MYKIKIKTQCFADKIFSSLGKSLRVRAICWGQNADGRRFYHFY